jgi:hypothetical protein
MPSRCCWRQYRLWNSRQGADIWAETGPNVIAAKDQEASRQRCHCATDLQDARWAHTLVIRAICSIKNRVVELVAAAQNLVHFCGFIPGRTSSGTCGLDEKAPRLRRRAPRPRSRRQSYWRRGSFTVSVSTQAAELSLAQLRARSYEGHPITQSQDQFHEQRHAP